MSAAVQSSLHEYAVLRARYSQMLAQLPRPLRALMCAVDRLAVRVLNSMSPNAAKIGLHSMQAGR